MRTIREASRFDQLVACAWWNAREASLSVAASRRGGDDMTLGERWYHERRAARLQKQADDLFAQAASIAP